MPAWVEDSEFWTPATAVDSTFGLPGRTVRMETAVHTPQREGENSVKSKRRLEQRKRAHARALIARQIQTKTQAKGSGR